MSDSTTPPTPPPGGDEPLPVIPDYTVYPEPIGEGSYGKVYLARDALGNWRAAKVVYRSRFDSDRPYQRELEGIQRFAAISHGHPSQLPIFHFGPEDTAKYFYYVMELADDANAGCGMRSAEKGGEDGGSRMEDGTARSASILHPPSSTLSGANNVLDPRSYKPRTLHHELKTRGRLPFQECLDISLALATALEHLHQHGLVHRDIKPGNIVFVHGRPKLADIGTVAGVDDHSLRHGGTSGYAPAEGPGSPSADVFSLGRVMYEIMSGLDRTECPRLPPGFETWQDHDRLLELNAVVGKATTAKATDRYATATDLHRDLVVVQAGRSIQQQEALRRRLKVARWALAGLLLVVLAVSGLLLAEARARGEPDRSAALRTAERHRTGVRTGGWTTNALVYLRQAADLRLDDDVRSQAGALLADLEVRQVYCNTNLGGFHLDWSSTGDALLVDGGDDYPSGLLNSTN